MFIDAIPRQGGLISLADGVLPEARNMRNAMDNLLDDVLADIFSYLPAQSLCSCKCVYRSWMHIISDSYQCKKLSQTVVGFFYGSWWMGTRNFTSITGEQWPSLSFLPFPLSLLQQPHPLLVLWGWWITLPCCLQSGDLQMACTVA
jgi:hypothetical protein